MLFLSQKQNENKETLVSNINSGDLSQRELGLRHLKWFMDRRLKRAVGTNFGIEPGGMINTNDIKRYQMKDKPVFTKNDNTMSENDIGGVAEYSQYCVLTLKWDGNESLRVLVNLITMYGLGFLKIRQEMENERDNQYYLIPMFDGFRGGYRFK